jgi:hypothetical protein
MSHPHKYNLLKMSQTIITKVNGLVAYTQSVVAENVTLNQKLVEALSNPAAPQAEIDAAKAETAIAVAKAAELQATVDTLTAEETTAEGIIDGFLPVVVADAVVDPTPVVEPIIIA